MSTQFHTGWSIRLLWCFVFSTAIVIISGLFVLALASPDASRTANVISWVLSIPLLPGIGFVSMVFGAWRAFHEGQIAWVPVVSVLIDSTAIFIVWEFIHSRRLAEAGEQTMLNLNG